MNLNTCFYLVTANSDILINPETCYLSRNGFSSVSYQVNRNCYLTSNYEAVGLAVW